LAENAGLEGFPAAPQRGHYKLRERILLKKRIYDLILDGKSYLSIQTELGISERTFYRYLDVIFSQEQDVIKETVPKEEIERQLKKLRGRYLRQLEEIDGWLKTDPNAKDRTELFHEREDLCERIFLTYDVGPATLFSRHYTHDDEEEEKEIEPLVKEKNPIWLLLLPKSKNSHLVCQGLQCGGTFGMERNGVLS
jgi:hypothetical protein